MVKVRYPNYWEIILVQAVGKCSVLIFTGINWILTVRGYFRLQPKKKIPFETI